MNLPLTLVPSIKRSCPNQTKCPLVCTSGHFPIIALGGIRTPDQRFSIQHRVSTTAHMSLLAGLCLRRHRRQAYSLYASPCLRFARRYRGNNPTTFTDTACCTSIVRPQIYNLGSEMHHPDKRLTLPTEGSYSLKTAALSPELRGQWYGL